jgi:hypothetical protein
VYWSDGQPPAVTPYSLIRDANGTVTTLGLLPNTIYHHIIEVTGLGGTARSDTLSFQTGTLPLFISRMRLELTGTPTSGYTMLSPVALGNDTSAVVAFDSLGTVRWYRLFADGLTSGESKQQLNGNYTIYLGRSQGWQPTYGRYQEFTSSGEVIARYAASPPFYTDGHELLLRGSGGSTRLHLFGYEIRHVDLSSRGGPTDALVAGHVLLRQTVDGVVEFMWNAWDHYGVQDWIEPTGTNPPLDFDHPNSLDIDRDGHYIVSFRHMGAIVKINAITGDLIWQLGGLRNQFSILNDPLATFSAQHCVRVLGNGNLLVYDNGLSHAPQESRAVEYRLDTTSKTAEMIWQYRHTPPLFTPTLGSVQRYGNGNTLVGFGGLGIVSEVGPTGNLVWEGRFMVGQAAGIFYRAERLRSLYHHEPF